MSFSTLSKTWKYDLAFRKIIGKFWENYLSFWIFYQESKELRIYAKIKEIYESLSSVKKKFAVKFPDQASDFMLAMNLFKFSNFIQHQMHFCNHWAIISQVMENYEKYLHSLRTSEELGKVIHTFRKILNEFEWDVN